MDLVQQIFFTTVAVSFGILHLMLYFYNRKLTSNLYFSIFLFLYAVTIFFDFQADIAGHEQYLFNIRMHRLFMPYTPLFSLLFLYHAFEIERPNYFWVLAALLAGTGLLGVIEPNRFFLFVQIPLILVIAEALYILYRGVKKRVHDAWIITAGFILLFLFTSYDLLMDLGAISSFNGINNGYPFGFVALILCSSIYLARDFAHTNNLILQREREAREMEIEKKVLEAEDQRKAKELQDARDVQLSLLPKCITDLQDYEFCFEMHPATEVGGDYYDYSVTDDGELSIAIGDATNHGMKAGMMVSIMKSLFISHVDRMEIKEFLNHCSKTIKQMKLRNLFMALMLVKINGPVLRISSAGIPPLLIYRRETDEIEEIKIKGMPLGAVDSFPYETVETELNEGDIVLMMTDGLAELFNSERESFGMTRLKQTFMEHAEKPASTIVEAFFSAAQSWRGDEQQNDDITFVAFRYKGT